MSDFSEQIRALKVLAESCGNWGRFDPSETDPNSSKLWVVFSHVRIPEGKFAQSKVMNGMDGHKLYLNCSDNQWYTHGIGDFSSSLPTTIYQILEATAPFQTTFVGHSMGAYLSLILGRLSETSRYVSTSPELSLGLKHSRSFENGVSDIGQMRNLSDILEESHAEKNGCVFFGAYDPIDCYFLAQNTADQIGPVYEVPHHHGVTEYFTGNRLYKDILSAEMKSDVWRSLEERNHLFDKGHHGSRQQYLHFYTAFRDYVDGADSMSLRAKASTFALWDNPGWQELRSKIWHRLNEPILSFESAMRAYLYQPDLIQFISIYGNACLRCGEKSKLCDVLDSMTQAQRQHKIGQRLLETTQEKFGVNFHETLTRKLEHHAPLLGLKKAPSSTVDLEERPADAEKLYKLNTHKEFDAVLSLTSPTLNPDFRYDIELAPARAIALIYSGDSSAGIRLLQALYDQGSTDQYYARALITAAQKLHNVDLLKRYLKLDIPQKWRSNYSKILKPCLAFVKSPVLIATILIELALCEDDDLEQSIEEFKDRFSSPEMQFTVARLIPCYADSADFNPKYRLHIVKLIKASDLSPILADWLPQELRSQEENTLLAKPD